jgi:hypothetical protein
MSQGEARLKSDVIHRVAVDFRAKPKIYCLAPLARLPMSI